MALSQALKELYSSNTVGGRYYETVQLSHTNFSKTFYLVQDTVSRDFCLDSGCATTKTFEPFPFTVVMPEQGSQQQDLNVVFANMSDELIEEIDKASENTNEPIECIFRIYIDGYDIPQTDEIRLVITQVSVNDKTISGTATRPDLYAKSFPSGNNAFFDSRFIGLS